MRISNASSCSAKVASASLRFCSSVARASCTFFYAPVPPAGSGEIPANISIGRQRRRCPGRESGLSAFGGLLRHRQLQDGDALAFAKQCHEHLTSVGKLDRIVVPIRSVGIDVPEFSDTEIDFPRPDPPVIVSDVLGEREFGPGQHADRDVRLAFRGEAACRSASEGGSDQGFSDLGGARRYGVQTIVTHRICSLFEISGPRPSEARASIRVDNKVRLTAKFQASRCLLAILRLERTRLITIRLSAGGKRG